MVEVRLKVCDDPQWIASVVELIEAFPDETKSLFFSMRSIDDFPLCLVN